MRTRLPFHPLERTAPGARLLIAILAALAVLASGQAAAPALQAVGAAYLALAAILWLLARRHTWGWLPYAGAVVDVMAVTTWVALVPDASPPLWPLYLLAVGIAALAGERAVFVTTVLAVGGHLLIHSALSPTAPEVWMERAPLALWPVALLLGEGLLLIALTRSASAERRARHSWQRVLAATQPIVGAVTPAEVAQVVTERARRLLQAERVWVWWPSTTEASWHGAQAGPSLDGTLSGVTMPPPLTDQRGVDYSPLRSLGGAFAALEGELHAVRHGGELVGVLGVQSPDGASRRAEWRVYLPPFTTWVGGVLAVARRYLANQEALHREAVLRGVAAELTATLEPAVAHQVLVRGARDALPAAEVSLVTWPAAGGIAGAPAGTGPVRAPREADDRNTPSTAAPTEPSSLLVHQVGGGLALVARRAQPLGKVEAAWLAQLARLAEDALARCAEHTSLQETEHRLSASFEMAPTPIAIWDTQSQALVLTNAAYQALEDPPQAGAHLTLDGEEHELQTGDPPRVFLVSSAPVPGGAYAVTVCREVTREREALHAKDTLVAMIGHELRTPLTSIRGYNDLMTRHLQVVQGQVAELNRLISDLMDISQLESGDLDLDCQELDLRTVLRGAAERFSVRHEEHKLDLDLPEMSLSTIVDPTRMGQVLDNVLNNAAKYSPTDQEISLTARVVDGEVQIAVRDQGIGIAPEHLPHVFERFYRAPDAATTRVQGSGLGLAIVHDLVRAHHGRVWAESAGVGQGCTVWISLPLATAAHTPLSAGAA